MNGFSAAADEPVSALPEDELAQAAIGKGDANGIAETDTEMIAGRTLKEFAEQLASNNRVERLRAIRSLGAFGAKASEALQSALQHPDAAVRYLAAVNLGRIGGKPLKEAKEQLTELATTEDESLLSVRLAAAYALSAGGEIDQYLPVLINAVAFPDRGTSCSACDLIAQLGPAASAATEVLEKTHATNKMGIKGGDYHVGGAAMNALRKIRARP